MFNFGHPLYYSMQNNGKFSPLNIEFEKYKPGTKIFSAGLGDHLIFNDGFSRAGKVSISCPRTSTTRHPY